MNKTQTDRIERSVVIRAPRSKVWKALADAKEFGKWFGVIMEGAFAPGAHVRGAITSKGYEHVTMDIIIEKMEPERYFSWRWHPSAVEKGVDYSKETRTLVEFTLAEVPEGTKLDVIESGFDQVPAARRDKALRGNSDGWTQQLERIRKHVS